MGIGIFRNNKFHFIVTADHVLQATDWIQWERAFIKANEILFNASEGQFQFGTIYLADNYAGLSSADILLRNSTGPSYTHIGGFGQQNRLIHLTAGAKSNILTILHELGHFVWSLGEEYTRNPKKDTIDRSIISPDRRTIPIEQLPQPTYQPGELANLGASAILEFANITERFQIVSNTSTAVVVNQDFCDLPSNAIGPYVWYQIGAECRDIAGENFCIMETFGAGAGIMGLDGVWQPNENPVTEFCTDGNHDMDRDTQQHEWYKKSCWARIIEVSGFREFTAPNPASGSQPPGWEDPQFLRLTTEPRFALVLDQSGSMRRGTKLEDTKYGATYWLEYAYTTQADDDQLAIIWYNDVATTQLNLTDINSLSANQFNDIVRAISNVQTGGLTSISNGLEDAVSQITTPPNRSAIQVALLMTDGKHNFPLGTAATDPIPDLRENGIQVYTLGVGQPNEVDLPPLERIATETGGRSYAVGQGNFDTIQSRMIEINAEVRGGIIDTLPTMLEAPNHESDAFFEEFLVDDEKGRPHLEEIFSAFDLDVDRIDPREILELTQGRLIAHSMLVEEGADRASFTISYPPNHEVWLYLLDPDGNSVEVNRPDVEHYISEAAPHEFFIIDQPQAGVWQMLIVRPTPGSAITIHAIGGIESKRLRVFGSTNSHGDLNTPVSLEANAICNNHLSRLKVEALIQSPSGEIHRLTLSDSGEFEQENRRIIEGKVLDYVHAVRAQNELASVESESKNQSTPSSGQYITLFSPEEEGHYTGKIIIINEGDAIIAQPMHRIMHTSENFISLRSDVPQFQRVIPFQFYVGTLPDVIDNEEREEPEMKQFCYSFEPLGLGVEYNVGAVLPVTPNGNGTLRLTPFEWSNGQSFDKGFARYTDRGLVNNSKFELELNNITLEVSFDTPVNLITLQFGEYGGNLNIWINGEFLNFYRMEKISRSTLGDVSVTAVYDSSERGKLTLKGDIHRFGLGGQELFINDYCFSRV